MILEIYSVEKALNNNNNPDIGNLNEVFIEQLIMSQLLKLFNSEKSKKILSAGYDRKHKLLALKCHRPCRSKSTYCDVGNHWIHYNCEKLSSNEIPTVESDNLNTHFCNLCKNNQNIKLIIPKRPSVIQNPGKIMLDEEQQTQICSQCDSSMDTTNTDICARDIYNNVHVQSLFTSVVYNFKII